MLDNTQFKGLVARSCRKFGKTAETDAGFVQLMIQLASACYPTSKYALPIPTPVVSVGQARDAVSRFVDGGNATMGDTFVTIWGTTIDEYLKCTPGLPPPSRPIESVERADREVPPGMAGATTGGSRSGTVNDEVATVYEAAAVVLTLAVEASRAIVQGETSSAYAKLEEAQEIYTVAVQIACLSVLAAGGADHRDRAEAFAAELVSDYRRVEDMVSVLNSAATATRQTAQDLAVARDRRPPSDNTDERRAAVRALAAVSEYQARATEAGQKSLDALDLAKTAEADSFWLR